MEAKQDCSGDDLYCLCVEELPDEAPDSSPVAAAASIQDRLIHAMMEASMVYLATPFLRSLHCATWGSSSPIATTRMRHLAESLRRLVVCFNHVDAVR